MVKGWLINSMDHSLVVNFFGYPTAKQVWDSAATTYFDGTDTSQIGISALIVGVQNILGKPVSNCMATQTSGMNYKLERNEMLLQLKTSRIKVIVVKFFCNSTTRNDGAWIIVSGATDHMTFDPNYFSNTTQPRKTCIANANGAIYLVTGDVLSEEIIGHGTKREGLYYLDDFSPGKANHTHHQTSSHERQI
ncbi:hypothetical protein CK203_091011 [Vitis vinifera]|uniref:Retrovirus-related Pol polyprotein from transposon TNT 1-94 n=1 Tax=Vitis vinifera TaxID=29760 RepID=A0A438CM48_VITVI|nr:hypothetical protein CK203_091011 [Vitis vinifera]